jgi:hypothetical protein
VISEECFWRAKTIVSRGEVELLTDSTPEHLHFLVKQRNGKSCDVYRVKTIYGDIRWSCNAVSEEKNRHGQIHRGGCVLYGTQISSEPGCSHTKACELWLKGDEL